jgi:hypothetical protein
LVVVEIDAVGQQSILSITQLSAALFAHKRSVALLPLVCASATCMPQSLFRIWPPARRS